MVIAILGVGFLAGVLGSAVVGMATGSWLLALLAYAGAGLAGACLALAAAALLADRSERPGYAAGPARNRAALG